VTLFERLPRGMQVTEAGRVVVEEARDLLARAERIRETAQRAARGEQGRLAVGYTSSAAFHPFVTQQIRAFRAERPGVVLALAEDGTPELVNGLREERLDAAFLRSTSNDLTELEAFRVLVGAPRQALHLGNRRWPHLDLKLEPRDRALVAPGVRVFERTSEMLRYVKSLRESGP
jgi:DNA-binding transcriptional LysR family regulator